MVPATPNERSATEATESVRAELAMVAWLLALPLLASVLGFVMGPALFVFGWMSWRGRERLVVAITSALLTGIGVWVVFERLLRVQLPSGMWSALLNG